MTEYLFWNKELSEDDPVIVIAATQQEAEKIYVCEVELEDDCFSEYIATEFWIQIFAPTKEEKDYRDETGEYLNKPTREEIGKRILAYFQGNEQWANEFLYSFDLINETNLDLETAMTVYYSLSDEILLHIWKSDFEEDFRQYIGIKPLVDLLHLY